MAILKQGELEYEAVSDDKISYNLIMDNHLIDMLSSGWNTHSNCSICIDGEEYVKGGRGLNFVIYDCETKQVIDSVSFDTWTESKLHSRNQALINLWLHNYEEAVCFN